MSDWVPSPAPLAQMTYLAKFLALSVLANSPTGDDVSVYPLFTLNLSTAMANIDCFKPMSTALTSNTGDNDVNKLGITTLYAR